MLKSNLRGKAFYITMGMNHRVNVIYYVSYYLKKKMLFTMWQYY